LTAKTKSKRKQKMTALEFKKARRDKLKLSQGEIAEALGLSRMTIIRYESGESPISPLVKWRMETLVKEVKKK
jgi:transcriptional regulator with XRE-family HTH domain